MVRSRIATDKKAALAIQNWWRSKLQIKSAKTLLEELRKQRRHRSAITIQSWWLRIKFLHYIEYKRRCIINIQAFTRGYIARNFYRALKEQKAREGLEKKLNKAAIVIQVFLCILFLFISRLCGYSSNTAHRLVMHTYCLCVITESCRPFQKHSTENFRWSASNSLLWFSTYFS